MTTFTLPCTPETIHWGYLSSTLKPKLTINPGDSVVIEAFSGGLKRMPEDRERYTILKNHLTIAETCEPKLGPHILTGPINITGAEPGDLLSVHVDKIELIENWGWNQVFIGDGVLLDIEKQFQQETGAPREGLAIIPLDPEKSEILLPWGRRTPAAPFFGVMAVKPPHTKPITSLIPGTFGGNMDIRLFGEGATIHFPVFKKGAGFSAGDGHGDQGDGEACGTAVECSLKGKLTFNLVKGGAFMPFPYAETPGHLITMAVDLSTNRADELALRQAIQLLTRRFEITPVEAYRHCSIMANSINSQRVNRKVGVHYQIDVSALNPRP